TGGIRTFTPQVRLALQTGAVDTTTDADYAESTQVTFDWTNWNVPRSIRVRAIDDHQVDGQDRQVFAPTLDYLNNLHGPLFVRGGAGDDRPGLFEREPVL